MLSQFLEGSYLTLGGYLNAHFPFLQVLELLFRIVVASLCGICIGFERVRRLKEAGMRTHVIVCCTAALMMIVSKYGFADLTSQAGVNFNGVRGADSARIAAQVVSGVSFLGAGAIFKSGNTIKGLTTAAGIWATAGVGLAVGAGMYALGIGFTALLIILQLLMHNVPFFMDSMVSHQYTFTIETERDFREAFNAYLASRGVQVSDSEITYHENDGTLSYKLALKVPPDVKMQELNDFIHSKGKVQTVSYSNVT